MLDVALKLSIADTEALLQGRNIVALSSVFITPGQVFGLYPDVSVTSEQIKHNYCSSFVPFAETLVTQSTDDSVLIKAWAKCELCQILNQSIDLETISKLTIWTKEYLQNRLQQSPFLFLTYLRVYRLSEPLNMIANIQGNFIALPQTLNGSENLPILNDTIFSKRRHQLENRLSPDYPELVQLQTEVTYISLTDAKAKILDQDLQVFLGWRENNDTMTLDSNLSWIKTIADTGNSSDGNKFEKLVRQSLVFLGFSNSINNPKANLDPESTGGAGGLDFYADYPYPIVGECKATKTEMVPDGTVAQLIKLGNKHLQVHYNQCIKIIMVAGNLNNHAEQTAIGNQINILRPETLQKLIELKAQHPGSINLQELKDCLESQPFGESADDKVNKYIEQVWEKIKLRSHLVQLIKIKSNSDSVGIHFVQGLYQGSAPKPTQHLSYQEISEILIELSSPLAGYLGKKTGTNGESQFYFLRDLSIL